jgi:serine/threonine protein kinase
MDFSIPLLAVAVILAFLAVALTLGYVLLRRRPKLDVDDPQHQVLALKRRTAEFGLLYSELQFGKLLGKGSQGEVYKAIWRGSNVAVKKIDTRKVQPEIIEEFCQEAEIMRRLRHPSLTLFMGVSLEYPHLCIVTEVVPRGSLFDIIHDEHSALTWTRCLSVALDVAQGMTYLHAHNPPILHRDLKSLNILVDLNWKGKVADFGMTRFQDKEAATMTQCGSPFSYTATNFSATIRFLSSAATLLANIFLCDTLELFAPF